MSTKSVHNNKYLRDEFNQQRINGIPDYYQWLVARLLETERNANNNEMAAAENFRLWQEAQSENERLNAAIDQFRDWLNQSGYPVAMMTFDRLLK